MVRIIFAFILLYNIHSQANELNENLNSMSVESPSVPADKDFNVRLKMPLMMMGSSSYEFSFISEFKLTDKLTIGPQISYLENTGHYYKFLSAGLGMTATYSFNNDFVNGWFLSPSLGVYSHNAKPTSKMQTSLIAPTSSVYLSLMSGYQWFFNNGFNIRFAAGAQYNTANQVEEAELNFGSEHKYYLRASDLNLDVDLSVGLVF